MSFPIPGGKTRVSNAGGRDPRWSRNGRELFFWDNMAGAGGLFAAAVQGSPSLTVGVPSELLRMVNGTTWDPLPDGSRFLVESPRGSDRGTRLVTVTDWFEELRRRAPAKK
jgi:hypothetical protein